MARQDKKYNQSDNYKKTFIRNFLVGIALLNKMIPNLKDANKVKVLEDMKTEFKYIVVKARKSSGSINDTEIYESVSSNVEGKEKGPFIKGVVEDKEVKEMFGYKESDMVKAYPLNECKDHLVLLLLKLRFVKAHGVYPTNNQLPLYFCKQAIAEACKQISVDYTSIPRSTGHGRKRHIFNDPKRKKQRMDPENLEVPHDLARMSKKQLVQHSTLLTRELQLIISNFDIPLENVSSYVKSYMEKPVTRAPMESSGGYQDPRFASDSNVMRSTATVEASHHCSPRDVEQVENHVLDQDHLTPTRSCGGYLEDTLFAFGNETIPLIDGANSKHVEYETPILTQPDFTNVNGQQHGDFTIGSSTDTDYWDSILAHFGPSYSPEIGLEEIVPARV